LLPNEVASSQAQFTASFKFVQIPMVQHFSGWYVKVLSEMIELRTTCYHL